MQQPRPKGQIRKKPDLLQNPQLTTAPMTLGRTAQIKTSQGNQTIPQINPIQVMQQSEQLWQQNDNIESINLMKGLIQYLKSSKFTDNQIFCLVHTNLAVSYYKIGFLEESQDQFANAVNILKDLGLAIKAQIGKLSLGNILKMEQKLKYTMLQTRIQLQTCILFSQMGKHSEALDHAQISCKLAYNMIYDIQLIQYQQLISILNKSKSAYAPNPDHEICCQGEQNTNLINNIVIIDQLINNTKDLKKQFINKDKAQLLEEERNALNKIGRFPSKFNIEMLYSLEPSNVDSLWIYKNKILDEIQMKFVHSDVFQIKNFWVNNQVIQKIVYLTISLYCYSTETRFIEKNKQSQDPSEVLDSEHWLSRSLQIAYTFLPHQAPILNQILTVHDRFHGIDKQTIPEDKQINGFFKVLRPLSKPKSNYTNKNTMCSPIMIRIQVPKIAIEVNDQNMLATQKQSESGSKMAVKNIDFVNKTIDLQSITKNNKIRGLNSSKKYDLTEVSQSTIKHKNNTKIDFTQNLKNIYASRKIKSVAQHNKAERMKINITGGISSEQIQGVKSMRRPHSYDKQIDKHEEIQAAQTERKKKSFSLNKKEDRRKRSATSNSTGLKLDGLQMLPNPFKRNEDDDHFQINSLSGRISNVETTKIGGNIFINNNINLFISKESLEQNGLSTKRKQDKTMYEISRRQNFINKRRAHHSNFTGSKNPQFIL